MKIHHWIVTAFFVLALGLPAMPVGAAAQQQTRSAVISLSTPVPNPANTNAGEVVFDLIISVSNINPGVTGADVYVRYDATVTPPPSPKSVAVAQPDFFGSSNVTVSEIAACPGGGTCIHLVLAGPQQVTHSGAAVRFYFQPVADGQACFSIVQSALADANGYPVEHGVGAQQCVTVFKTFSVTGTVLRQGVPANPNPGNGSLACSRVTMGDLSAYTDSGGNFALNNVRAGTYTLRAVYPGYLASEKAVSISTGSTSPISAGTTRLRGGDVNGDNAINILDVGSVISKFGATGVAVRSASANCTGADEPADINDDSMVNISDLAIVAGNWNNMGPSGWNP